MRINISNFGWFRQPRVSFGLFILVLSLSACATPEFSPKKVEAPTKKATAMKAQQTIAEPIVKRFKRKIAIGRFTNETRYGRTFLRDGSSDPLGKQAFLYT